MEQTPRFCVGFLPLWLRRPRNASAARDRARLRQAGHGSRRREEGTNLEVLQ